MKTFNLKTTPSGAIIAVLISLHLSVIAQVTPIVDTHHIMWSTQLGSSGTDKTEGLACEFLGNNYSVGHVSGADATGLDLLLNSYKGGSFDGFITKSNIYGQTLWSTFIGGNGNDFCTAIAPTNDDHIVVTGYTSSTNMAFGSVVTTYGGGNRDAFCSKLTKDGEIVWTVYIGGNGDDYTQDLALDSEGNVFIVGKTGSNLVPYVSELQADYGGGSFDGFVAKVTPTGQINKFSYLGGMGTDEIKDLTFDREGNLCICGATSGTDVLSNLTTIPYFGGVSDAFITCINSEFQINWAEYVGGAGADLFNSVALDTAGNLIVGGNTNSDPIAFLDNSGVLSPNNTDAMLMSFSPFGTLLWSEFVSGSGVENIKDIHVDLFGNVYVGGTTDSGNLQTLEAFQQNSGGALDIFISKFSTLGELKWLSYMGGSGNDWFGHMDSDRFGKLMIGGYTNSAVFGEEINYGTTDAFSARISDCNNPDVVIHTIDDTTFCYGEEALFTACGADHYVWMNADTFLLTTVDTTSMAFVKGYRIEGCWGMSNKVEVNTLQVPFVTITPMGPTTFCGEGQVDLIASSDMEDVEFSWNDPAHTEGEFLLTDTARTYTATALAPNGCEGSESVTIEFIELPAASMAVAQNSVCVSGTPVNLLGLPDGGYFVGEGVVGNTFDPGLAGGGIHELQYVIMDKNGCEGSSASASIEVLFFPTVIFVADDSICTFDPPFELAGEPAGGSFSGDGVLGNIFYPALPGTGGQNVSYTYVDNQGCINVATQVIFVDPCLSTQELEEATRFSVYPNPAENYLVIQSPDNNQFSASIVSASGQLIENFNGFNQIRIPTEQLAAGCYIVKINAMNNSSVVPLLIQH